MKGRKIFLAGYPVSGKLIGRISGIRQTYWSDIRYSANLLVGYPAESVSGTYKP